MKSRIFAAGLLLAANAFAAGASPAQAVFRVILDADMCADQIELGSGGLAEFEKASTELSLATQTLDTDVAVAIKAVKGKPDVQKAIKEFYAAASAYISNGIPTTRLEKATSERLKAEMDSKEKSLKLEMKLAGID